MSVPFRAGRRSVQRLRESLSERDCGILEDVQKYRFLSKPQLEELHFSSHATEKTGARTARSVLARLTRDGLLCRLSYRSVGGLRGGSSPYIYCLGQVGHRVLHANGGRWRRPHPSVLFVDHVLAVAQLAVELHRLAREDRCQLLVLQTEPQCWRTFSKGLAGGETLKPDLYVALGLGEWEIHWFCEIDRGTESSTALLRKLRSYQAYWASGAEQDAGGIFPRVLWVVPSERRMRLIERTIRASSHLQHDLFRIALSEEASSRMIEVGQ